MLVDYIKDGNLISKEEIYEKYSLIEEYGPSDFILVVLGGDLRTNDLESLIKAIEIADFPALIAPYRFKKELVESLVDSSKIKVLDEFVDLLSLMNSAKLLIYGAGMGMTIEAGVLEVPSIKIAGFHEKHGSVDLANNLNIPIFEIKQLHNFLKNFNQNINRDNESYTKNHINKDIIPIDL